MLKRQEKILELIQSSQSKEEITKELKIKDEILKKDINELTLIGFNITRQFFYDGTQKYILKKDIPNQITPILGIPKDGTFRAIATSDYHIGSNRENLKYVQKIYDFAKEEDIHIILNGGDLVEGMLNNHIHKSHYEQIEYLLENHPYDSKILNFITLGNHDESLIKDTGIDLHTILNTQRDDLVSLGYGINNIGINKEKITMCHIANNLKHINSKLKLTGHGHRYQFKVAYGMPTVFLPTLSNEVKDGYPPGFVEINIDIKDGFFTKANFILYTVKQKGFTRVSNSSFNYENNHPEKTYCLNKFH